MTVTTVSFKCASDAIPFRYDNLISLCGRKIFPVQTRHCHTWKWYANEPNTKSKVISKFSLSTVTITSGETIHSRGGSLEHNTCPNVVREKVTSFSDIESHQSIELLLSIWYVDMDGNISW